MRDFVRKRRAGVDFETDLEEAERIAMFAILVNIGADAGKQREAHQGLIRRDRIGDVDVGGRVQAEGTRSVFADERIVVDFGEALVHDYSSYFVLEAAHRICGRNRRWHERRFGSDGIVTDEMRLKFWSYNVSDKMSVYILVCFLYIY